MASQTKTWIGNAAPKTQVWQYNPPVTAAAPTWTITVNGKTLSYKSNGTPADAISGMLTLWRACQYPEFREISASKVATSTAVPQGAGTNEKQSIVISGSPTGGTFTLSWNGSANVTAAIPYNASASAVQNALQEVTAIGAGNMIVTGSGTAADPFIVEFVGTLAATAGQALLVPGDSLTGGTNPGLVISRYQNGVAANTGATTGYLLLTGKPGVPFTVTSEIEGTTEGNISISETSETNPTVTIARTTVGKSAVQEVQSVYLDGTPTGGTFTLTFSGQTTAGIAYNASAATVQTALEALSNIAPGDIAVTGAGTSANPWVVTFLSTGTLTGAQPVMTGSGAGVTGTNTVTVTTIQDGAASANEIQTIGFVVPLPTIHSYKITGSNATDNSAYPILVTESSTFAAILPAPGGNTILVRAIPFNATPTQFLARITAALGGLGTASSLYAITQVDNGTLDPDANHLKYSWQIAYQGALAGINLPQASIYPASCSSAHIFDSSTQTIGGDGRVHFTNVTWADGAATTSAEMLPDAADGGFGVTVYFIASSPVIGDPDFTALALIESTQQNGSPTGVNEIQKITLSANAVGGTFTLTFGANTTSAIAYNASAATVQSDLQALASIGAGNVAVSGNAGGPWTATFQGTMAQTNEAQMTGDGTLLQGDTIEITELVHGSAGQSEVETVTLTDANGGTFTLSFNGQTTVAISTTASAATVQTDLTNLSTIGSGNVAVSGSAGGPYTVTFQSSLANLSVPPLSGDASGMLQVLVEYVSLNDAASGSFTLSFGGQTTLPIAYNASAATVQTDLQALSTIGSGNATVSGAAGGPYTVTITLAKSLMIDMLTGDGTSLTGSGSAVVALATILCQADGPNFWDNIQNWLPNQLPQAYLPAGPDIAAATAVVGGALTAGTYYYKVTATNANGETTPGAEGSGTTSGGNLTLNVSWNSIAHATGYKLYRGTVAGSENVLVATITDPNRTFFADVGGTTSAASPPGANTAVGDDVHLTSSAISILYNLPQDHLRINSYTQDASYTGRVGNPRWNGTTTAGYWEYRDTQVKLGAPASGTLALNIGQGFGAGSPFTYLDTGTYQVSMVVSGMAVPTSTLPCMLWTGSNASSEIDLFKGTMGIAYYPDETAQVATIRQAYQKNVISDSTLTIGAGCATIPLLEKNGGDTLLSTTVTTLNGKAGTLTQDNGSIGTLLDLEGMTYTSRSTGAIAALKVAGAGKFDRSQDSRPLSIGTTTIYSGATFLDPHGATVTTGQSYIDIQLVECGVEDVTVVVGKNVTLRRTQN